LNDAVLDAAAVRHPQQFQRLVEGLRRRRFAVDMLALFHRTRQQTGAQLRRRGVEKYLVIAGERCVDVGGPPLDAIGLRKVGQFFFVTADQQGIGHNAIAIGQRHPALLPDGDDRTDQMLVHPHPPGHPVHDDAEPLIRHRTLHSSKRNW
jgi:hypothetical protein